MLFELGKNYSVKRLDGTIVTFKMIGGEPLLGEVDGQRVPLTSIYTQYLEIWEEPDKISDEEE